MALAVRRLLLRPNRYNYRRPNLAIQQLSLRTLPASHQRQFHLCEPRLDDKKSASSQSGSPPKPDETQEASASAISQTAIETASREWVQEFYQRIEKTGDIGAVLDMLDDETLSEKERGEVLSMVNELQGLDAEAAHYKNLVDAIINAPKDPGELDALLTSMGQDPKELLEGLSAEENMKLVENGTDPEQPFNLEAAVLEALDDAFADNSKLPSIQQLENLGKLNAKEILERSNRETGDANRDRAKMSLEDVKKISRQWARDKRIEQMFGVENKPDMEQEKDKPGFWNDGDLDSDMGEDEEFAGDDITAQGHAELERHREMREYARLAVWELPLLSKLARPFEPPAKDQVLRFRYTTYLGEDHPSANKIVLEVSPEDLELTPVEKNKLIKLAGVRYNPSTKIIKMSCESFETQAQNKRYLGDLVDVLIREAKDPQDTFEDVPFDFRHHKPKPVYEFPEEWKLTPERKRSLEERRMAKLEKEGQRVLDNKVVDGLLLTPTGQKDRQQYETLREEQIKGLEEALQKGSRARMVVPALLTLDRKSRGKKRVGAGKAK